MPAKDRCVAFWAATILNGLVPPREVGLLCHASGEPLAEVLPRFASASKGDWFSLVGEVLAGADVMLSRSASESIEASRERDCGESSLRASEERCRLRRFARGEGVLAGEDFCGEMDLARSVGGNESA